MKARAAGGKGPLVAPFPKSEKAERDVERYLEEVGIQGVMKREDFGKKLYRSFGDRADRVVDALQRKGAGLDVDFYGTKNEDLGLSLALTSQYAGDLHREFLSWFLREGIGQPKRVLDLGCDIGITTCFYALLYPEAEVIGVDRCPESISFASQIAQRLDLPNVRFVTGEVMTESPPWAEGGFDLVVATTFFREALESLGSLPSDDHWELDEVMASPASPQQVSLLQMISGWLEASRGYLVAVERLASRPRLTWWIDLVESGALRVDFDKSFQLKFLEAGKKSGTLPILVARPGGENPRATQDQISAFYAYQSIEDQTARLEFEGVVAEELFKILYPRTLVERCEVTYCDGSGVEYLEIWASASFAILFSHTNTGYRRLHLRPIFAQAMMIEHMAEFASAKKKAADVRRFSEGYDAGS